jgi:hypothetical protein
VFIGLLTVAFVGVGIQAFYPEPRMPVEVMYANGSLTPELQAVAREYQDRMALYNRNVAVISAAAAIGIMIFSLTAVRAISLFSDGLLLGGLLTFAYSVMRGFGAEDNVVRFIIVSIGFAAALALGYFRFVRPSTLPTPLAESEEAEPRPRAA